MGKENQDIFSVENSLLFLLNFLKDLILLIVVIQYVVVVKIILFLFLIGFTKIQIFILIENMINIYQ